MTFCCLYGFQQHFVALSDSEVALHGNHALLMRDTATPAPGRHPVKSLPHWHPRNRDRVHDLCCVFHPDIEAANFSTSEMFVHLVSLTRLLQGVFPKLEIIVPLKMDPPHARTHRVRSQEV